MKSAITLKRSRLQKRISFKKLDISHQKEKLEEKAPHTQNKFFKKVQLRMWITVWINDVTSMFSLESSLRYSGSLKTRLF